jgi:hypothetical protein
MNKRGFERNAEIYYGKLALLHTWERQPTDVQAQESSTINRLRRRIAQARAHLQNATRNSPLEATKANNFEPKRKKRR